MSAGSETPAPTTRVVGNGGPQATSWNALVPEIQNPPDRGAAIFVFELPGKDVRNRAAR